MIRMLWSARGGLGIQLHIVLQRTCMWARPMDYINTLSTVMAGA